MRPQDEATAAAAVQVLLKGTGAEACRCASAALEGLGIDPDPALAEAREAARARGSGAPGPLRKTAGPAGAVTVSRELAGGRRLTLEMAPDEALGFVSAVQQAMYGRGAQ